MCYGGGMANEAEPVGVTVSVVIPPDLAAWVKEQVEHHILKDWNHAVTRAIFVLKTIPPEVHDTYIP